MSKILNILWKDILTEMRARDIVFSVLVFALLVMVIFSFAFDPKPETISLIGPGILWVAFTFAGVLGLTRTFAQEKERGCLQGLLLCPVDRDVIYWGKMLAALVFMLFVELIILPIFSILFNLPLFMPRLILIMALATVGFAAVGTIFSAIAVNTRAREIMLPLLFFPVVVPLVIAAVEGSAAVIAGKPWGDLTSWLVIILAFDAIFLVVASITFEFVVEE